MKNSILTRRLTRKSGGACACAVMLFSAAFTSCSDDLLVGTPSWLGESIYEELESRGNFTETLKLVNAQDEDYASMLKKTGSLTMFAADDEAWKKFYENNPWGVKSLDEMTNAQKKIIFKSNMINSAYLVELLGNIPAATSAATDSPTEGSCMRRSSRVEINDSIPFLKEEDFPVVNTARVATDTKEQIDYWSEVRGRGGIKLLQDDNVATMIHFTPKFMQNNSVTDEDVRFLTNGEISKNSRSFVNGKVITEENVTCQNGYVHVLEGVAMPMDNMANIIASNPQFSIYSRLLDRFSYPKYSRELSLAYGDGDSVFVKRYFNNGGMNHNLDRTDGGVLVSNGLPFDPGWNSYVLNNTSGITFQHDAAVMLVPTDEAMMTYLKTHGQDINKKYAVKGNGDGPTPWDNAPDAVILPLLKNTMLTSLKSSLPSSFASITNTASEPMDVKETDIDQVLWACNGAIYQTNKVYVSPEYQSVYYPAVIRENEDMHIIHTGIENDNKVAGGEGFKAYLNNMGSKYSFIMPTDDALQNYYDPVSRYRYTSTKNGIEPTSTLWKFKVGKDGFLAADAYIVNWDDLDENGRAKVVDGESAKPLSGSSAPGTSTSSSGETFNHFKDIVYTSMATSLFTYPQEFYLSRQGTPIIVRWDSEQRVNGVAGAFQYEKGYFIDIDPDPENGDVVDKTGDGGNGRTYVANQEPIQCTTLSPYAAITDDYNYPDFSEFAKLLDGCSFVTNDDGANHATQNKAIKTLNNYNYTIYIPKNDGIQSLINEHKIPTWEELDAVESCMERMLDESDEAKNSADYKFLEDMDTTMRAIIENFVAYHIQDNSVFVKGENHNGDVYESACLDTLTTRFCKIKVNYTFGGEMQIVDNAGNTHAVDSHINNIMTRQYFFNGSSLAGTSCKQIVSSSSVVIHQIDTPMLAFKKDEDHPDAGFFSKERYDKLQAVLAAHPVKEEGEKKDVRTYKSYK